MMKLLSLNQPDHYPNLSSLLIAVNEFAGAQEYDVVKRRTKKSVKEVLRKAVLRCDKGRSSKDQGFGHRETSIVTNQDQLT